MDTEDAEGSKRGGDVNIGFFFFKKKKFNLCVVWMVRVDSILVLFTEEGSIDTNRPTSNTRTTARLKTSIVLNILLILLLFCLSHSIFFVCNIQPDVAVRLPLIRPCLTPPHVLFRLFSSSTPRGLFLNSDLHPSLIPFHTTFLPYSHTSSPCSSLSVPSPRNSAIALTASALSPSVRASPTSVLSPNSST